MTTERERAAYVLADLAVANTRFSQERYTEKVVAYMDATAREMCDGPTEVVVEAPPPKLTPSKMLEEIRELERLKLSVPCRAYERDAIQEVFGTIYKLFEDRV